MENKGRKKRNEQAKTPALDYAKARAGRGLQLIVLLQVLKTGAGLAFAGALASFVGTLVETSQVDQSTLVMAVVTLALHTGLSYANEARTAGLEATLAHGVLETIKTKLIQAPASEIAARPRGDLVSGVGRHPAALARLAVGHTAARKQLALGPLLVAAAVAFVSWQAALALILATPVMIVFFALIGGHIHNRAQTQEAALGRLAAQFTDRIRALPTILANEGLAHERTKLHRRLTAYAKGTMSVLAIAFLNAAVLDFFASLAIAILAVFLGLGHLGLANIPGFAHLALSQSLFVLLLAPEFFAPFRRYAEQYHAKAEGEAAAKALTWAFEPTEAHEPLSQSYGLAGVKNLTLSHIGAIPDFTLPDTGLVVITGPSGIGKSTLLRALAGIEAPVSGVITLPENETALPSWASTDALVPKGTLGQAIGHGTGATPEAITSAAHNLGLLDDPHWSGGLDAPIRAGAENLSGGQRVRIAIARLLLRPGLAFCDEPTAKLDPVNAHRVRTALAQAAHTRLVLVATHDEALIALADQHIGLGSLDEREEREAA